MRIPDNLDLFEMHEREQVRMSRRRKRTERIDEAVDKEIEEERLNNEKRTTGKS